jgi:prepilin-type N-terminal cleavage/methylation domain-containing protein
VDNNDANIQMNTNNTNKKHSYHSYRPHSHRSRGFTLLELLLSIAAIGILAGLSLPVFRTMVSKNSLDVAAVSVVQDIRRAQVLSRSVDGDTTWGINLTGTNLTLFKGASYASRDTDFDEITDISGVSFSGVTEIVFAKFTGLPDTTGDITLSAQSDSETITVNSKGMISY